MGMDLNDAPEQRQDGVIPDGTFAQLKLQIRPGDASLPGLGQCDAGLFTQSRSSDVVMLDCELTVLAGPHRARKFWQMMTVAGGNLNADGISKGWLITKANIRAMVESAMGIDPKDMSEAAKAKRNLPNGFCDLDGIEFVGKIGVEKGGPDERGGYYPDKNRLAHIVTPNEPEYAVIMGGGEVAPKPSSATGGNGTAARRAPAQESKPAWQRQAAPATAVAPAQAAASSASGPAWLRG